MSHHALPCTTMMRMQEFSYPTFEEQFKRMLKLCEARAEEAKKAPAPAPNTKNLDAVKSKVRFWEVCNRIWGKFGGRTGATLEVCRQEGPFLMSVITTHQLGILELLAVSNVHVCWGCPASLACVKS